MRAHRSHVRGRAHALVDRSTTVAPTCTLGNVTPPVSAPARRRQDALAVAALATLVLAANVQVYEAGSFLLDDTRFIFDNPLVVDRGTLPTAELWRTPSLGYPVPALVWLWSALGSAFGLTFRALHAANVIVHALGVLLLFGAARSLRLTPPFAALAAALLALHPLSAEPVAWLTQLSVLCVGALTAASVCLLARWSRPSALGSTPSLVGAATCLVLALAFKPSAIALPLLVPLVAWARAPERLSQRSTWFATTVCAAFAIGSALLTLENHASGEWILPQHGIGERSFTVLAAAAWHVKNTLLPFELHGWYERPPVTLAGGVWRLAVVAPVALGLSVLALHSRTRGTGSGIGAALVLLGYAPHAGVPEALSRFIGESHLYVPLFGLGLMASHAASVAARNSGRRRTIVLGSLALLLALGALRTAHQARYTHAHAFWLPVLERYPYHPKAAWCVGFGDVIDGAGNETWGPGDLVPAIGVWARAHVHRDPRHGAMLAHDPDGLTKPIAQALERLDENAAGACVRQLDYRSSEAELRRCFETASDTHRDALLHELRLDEPHRYP